MQMSEKRFPVIADQKNGILKTGFITSVLDKTGKAIITTDQQADIEKKYNQARDRQQKHGAGLDDGIGRVDLRGHVHPRRVKHSRKMRPFIFIHVDVS